MLIIAKEISYTYGKAFEGKTLTVFMIFCSTAKLFLQLAMALSINNVSLQSYYHKGVGDGATSEAKALPLFHE